MTAISYVSQKEMEDQTGFATALGYSLPKEDKILVRKGLTKKKKKEVLAHEEEHIAKGEEGPLIGALIGAGASILGGAIGADAAKSASKKALKGTQQQIAYAKESRDMARADTRHTRQAGATALNALMAMTGLPFGGGAGAAPAAPIEGDVVPVDQPVAAQRPVEGMPSRYQSAYNIHGRAGGGHMYNINEMGPENVYAGGHITRNPNPMTIDGQTGYVEPNIQGRAVGGAMDYMQDPQRPVAMAGPTVAQNAPQTGRADVYNALSNRVGRGGKYNFDEGEGLWMGPRGNPRKHQKAPPPGYKPPQVETDVDTTLGQDYNWQTDPGYQFRFDEGMRGLENSAAARGGLLSGGFGRKAIRYGQGFASNEFSNVYNRIMGIAGMGQVANQHAGNAAQYGGAAMGQGAAAGGINSAYGDIGQGNAWANAGNQIAQMDWGNVFNKGGAQSGGEYRPNAAQAFGSWKDYNPFDG